MRATTEVDWHVNVWSEQINGPQIYQAMMYLLTRGFDKLKVGLAEGTYQYC